MEVTPVVEPGPYRMIVRNLRWNFKLQNNKMYFYKSNKCGIDGAEECFLWSICDSQEDSLVCDSDVCHHLQDV